MRKRIAQFTTLSLVLFMTAGDLLNSSANCLLSITNSAFVLQDQSPPGRKRNQRCLVAPLPGCPRASETNNPPDVKLKASARKIIQSCKEGTTSQGCTPSETQQVQLQVLASDGDGDTLRYTYSTTGGRIKGEGPNVEWELKGVQPGTYTATVEVDDGCGCVAFSSTTVTVAVCGDCGSAGQ